MELQEALHASISLESMKQVSLFDFITVSYPDFRDISHDESIRIISDATGLDFKPKYQDLPDEWWSCKKIQGLSGLEITLCFGQYNRFEGDKEKYIGVDCWDQKQLSGRGVGVDSIESAVARIKSYMKAARKFRKESAQKGEKR